MNPLQLLSRTSAASSYSTPAPAHPGDAPNAGSGFADMLSRVRAPAGPAIDAAPPVPAAPEASKADTAAHETSSPAPSRDAPADDAAANDASRLDPRGARAPRTPAHAAAERRRGTAKSGAADIDTAVESPVAPASAAAPRAGDAASDTTARASADPADAKRPPDTVDGPAAVGANPPALTLAQSAATGVDPTTSARPGTPKRAPQGAEAIGANLATAATAATAATGTQTARAAAPRTDDAPQDLGRDAIASARAAAASTSIEPLPVATALPTPGATGTAMAARADAAIPQTHVTAPIDTPGFAPALATQVRWFVEDGVHQASLTLNPAEMGPVAVRIQLDGSQARIDFAADVAATRGAIESSLPTLAAALADSGLTLAGGGVFDGSARQQGEDARRGDASRASGHGAPERADAGSEALRPLAPAASRPRGLVDLVA